VLYLIIEFGLNARRLEAGQRNQWLISSRDRIDIHSAAAAIKAYVAIN
jgi:hypothetical protein